MQGTVTLHGRVAQRGELHQTEITINSSSFLGWSQPTEHEGVRNNTITSMKNVTVGQSSIFGNWEVILSAGWYS